MIKNNRLFDGIISHLVNRRKTSGASGVSDHNFHGTAFDQDIVLSQEVATEQEPVDPHFVVRYQ